MYKGISVQRYNADQLRISPCCQSTGALESVDQFDFATSPHLNSIRKKITNGEKAVECDRCWKTEAHDVSRRQSMLTDYPTQDNSVLLESIDYNATWACNLACIMCDERFSSTWAKELEKTATDLEKIGRRYNNSNPFISQFDLKNVKRVHFNGGEPLLNDSHLEMLETLDRDNSINQVSLSYNTNATQYPSDRAIDLWAKAKQVILFFSIDGTDKSYEYIRYPGNWNQTVDNMLKIKDKMPTNVTFGFNVTVGCYNIFEIADVLVWFKQHLAHNRDGNFSDFSYQMAYNFDINLLNYTAKISAIKYLTPYSELLGLVNMLKSELKTTENNHWISKLDTIDQRRNTNWRQALQIAEYY